MTSFTLELLGLIRFGEHLAKHADGFKAGAVLLMLDEGKRIERVTKDST